MEIENAQRAAEIVAELEPLQYGLVDRLAPLRHRELMFTGRIEVKVMKGAVGEDTPSEPQTLDLAPMTQEESDHLWETIEGIYNKRIEALKAELKGL